MYSSGYAASPVRASTTRTETNNYQSQTQHYQYYQPTPNQTVPMQYNSVGYSNAPLTMPTNPARVATPSTRNQRDFNDSSRYQSTGYVYNDRPVESRPSSAHYGSIGSHRAYSYDDLYRSNPSNPVVYRNPPSPAARRSYNVNVEDDLVVKSTDLSAVQEQELIELVRSGFEKYDISNQRELAGFLKRSADNRFSACWHCIVGRQFSSYVTHEINGFIYLTKGPISILLFKSGA